MSLDATCHSSQAIKPFGDMRPSNFVETPEIRLQWFYDMVEADHARQKKRTRELDEDSSDDSWAIPERPSPYVSKRARIRQANYAFQDDWGLGDTSSILPLPLEHELEQAAQTDNARPRTASPKERTDAPDDAPLLRFGRGHRLIRQPARSLPQMIISTRRS